MKIRLLFVLLSTIIILSSCSTSEPDPCADLVCEGDCQLMEIKQAGKMRYISCYDTWAILVTAEDGIKNVGLAPTISEEYKIADKEVTFSATYFENDLPLIIPDPSPLGRVYRIALCEVGSK